MLYVLLCMFMLSYFCLPNAYGYPTMPVCAPRPILFLPIFTYPIVIYTMYLFYFIVMFLPSYIIKDIFLPISISVINLLVLISTYSYLYHVFI